MNYLSVEQISKSFGDRILFEDLSFGINKDQKIGFVAKNGTGKTTLLKIISGEDSPDKGQIILRNGLKVGYLSQKENLNEQLSVEESIFNADNTVLKIIQEYEKALKNPEDEQAYQKAFDRCMLECDRNNREHFLQT